MIKIRINSNGNVLCPREDNLVCAKDCINCEDSFMVSFPENKVLCKRGINKDSYLKKSGNRRLK